MAQHVRAQRFAHMTPLLWFMLAVGGVLLIAALVMAGYMLIGTAGRSR